MEKIKGESWDAFKDRTGDNGRDVVMWVARRQGGYKNIAGIGGEGRRGGLHDDINGIKTARGPNDKRSKIASLN